MVIHNFLFFEEFWKKKACKYLEVVLNLLNINFYMVLIINIIYSSQDNLLSDEEAKEIKKLLSPDNDQLNTSDWMSEVLSVESNDNVNNQRYFEYLYFQLKITVNSI